MTTTEFMIRARHGSISKWWEKIDRATSREDEDEERYFYRRELHGADRRRPDNGKLDHESKDVSVRHNKKRIANLVIEGDDMKALQTKWQKAYRSVEKEESKIDYQCAIKTMTVQHMLMENGLYRVTEDQCEALARKRGRDWEIAADPDYPEDDIGSGSPHHRVPINRVQRKFFVNSRVPPIQHDHAIAGADTVSDTPTLPKRRRINAKVSFANNVEVCSLAGIDKLRWAVKPKFPPRTPPLEPGEGDMKPHAVPHTTPKKELRSQTEVRPLHDGLGRSASRFNRSSRTYRPGAWAPTNGGMIVDTSGDTFKSDWDAWEKACRYAQQEAAGVDALGGSFHIVGYGRIV